MATKTMLTPTQILQIVSFLVSEYSENVVFAAVEIESWCVAYLHDIVNVVLLKYADSNGSHIEYSYAFPCTEKVFLPLS